MPRPARWRDLRGGVASLVAVVGLALAILVFGNVNSLHGGTVRLYAGVMSARGVMPGTEVWLYGRKVGLVEDVSFLPATTDTARRLVVAMSVLDRYRENIRTDASVQIRSGTTLIGAPVIYISSGSARARAVAEGDTILAVPQNDFESVASDFSLASREFPAIVSNVRLIGQALRGTEGTLGALGLEKGVPELDATQAQLRRLGRKLDSRTGTIGLTFGARPTVVARARMALARADSIRALVAGGRVMLGRFRADTSFPSEVSDVRNEISVVLALMRSPTGNLGRFATDSALVRALAGAQQEMTALFLDVRRHPLRYLNF